MQPQQQNAIDRFIALCQADERIIAALLYGSWASGQADFYSDLDLSLIIADPAYESFVAGREAFVQQLGQTLFLEDFDLPDIVFFILLDDTEIETLIASEEVVASKAQQSSQDFCHI